MENFILMNFYKILEKLEVEPGDMLLILAGGYDKTLKQAGELRLEMGRRMKLIKEGEFKAFGSLIFHCWNGMKIRNDSLQCITHLLRHYLKIYIN